MVQQGQQLEILWNRLFNMALKTTIIRHNSACISDTIKHKKLLTRRFSLMVDRRDDECYEYFIQGFFVNVYLL